MSLAQRPDSPWCLLCNFSAVDLEFPNIAAVLAVNHSRDPDFELDALMLDKRWACLLTCCVVLASSSPGATSLLAQEGGIKFKPKLLMIDANEGLDVADINGDGKLDVVAGRNWYQAPEFTPRPLRNIEDWNGYVQSNGDFCLDVDQDGWTDVVAGSFVPTEVNWFKNPGAESLKLGQTWKVSTLVDTKLSQNEASFLHDFDGDGKPEWVTNSWNNNNPLVVWSFETKEQNTEAKQGSGQKIPNANPPKTIPFLAKHVIGKNGNGHGMGFGDINNDGREDVLINNGWYERPTGNALNQVWKFHSDWDDLHASCPMLVCDLDQDGKQDLIWGKGHGFGLYWWQGQGPDEDGKLTFEQHLIDDTFSQPHTLHFADLDGDGTHELITGKRVRAHNGNDPGGADMPCMYYFKWDAEKKSFDRFVIDEGHIGTGLQIRTADLDGNGSLDIAVAGKDGTWILFNQKQ